MSRRRGKKQQQEKPRLPARVFAPDARLLLTVGLPISLIAAVVFNSNENEVFSIHVFYVWYSGIILAYLLQLTLLGRFVLPPTATHPNAEEARINKPGEPAFREGATLLYFQAFIVWLPNNIRKKVIRYPELDIPPYIPDSFRTHRAGFLPSHYAAVIGRFNTLTHVAGPGYVRAGYDEKFLSFIDLSLQFRVQEAKVTTRDGIPLDTSVTAMFQAKPPGETPDPNIPFPYSKEVLFRLHSAEGRDAKGAPVHWSDRLTPSIISTLANEVAKYRLDALHRPRGSAFGEEETTPIERIRENLAQNLRRQLKETFEFDRDEDNPISLFMAQYGGITPPDTIVNQRVANINAEWQQEQERQMLEAEQNDIITRRLTRTNAQVDIIRTFGAIFKEIEKNPAVDIADVIILRTIEALDLMVEGRRADQINGELQPDDQEDDTAANLAEYLNLNQT